MINLNSSIIKNINQLTDSSIETESRDALGSRITQHAGVNSVATNLNPPEMLQLDNRIYKVVIKSDDNIWQSEYLSQEEFNNEFADKLTSKKTIHPILAMLCPVRVDNAKNFAKDFFFPTVLNQGNRFGIVGKIFCGILDVATLAFRLISSPFRYAIAKKWPEQEHPLTELVKKNFPNIEHLENVEVHVITWQASKKPPREGLGIITNAILTEFGKNINLVTQHSYKNENAYVIRNDVQTLVRSRNTFSV